MELRSAEKVSRIRDNRARSRLRRMKGVAPRRRCHERTDAHVEVRGIGLARESVTGDEDERLSAVEHGGANDVGHDGLEADTDA